MKSHEFARRYCRECKTGKCGPAEWAECYDNKGSRRTPQL